MSHSSLLKIFFSFKYTMLSVLLFSVGFTLFHVINYTNRDEISVLDFVADIGGQVGTSNLIVIIFGVIPIVCIYVFTYLDKTERYYLVIHQINRIKLWNKVTVNLLLLSVTISFLLVFVGYISGGFILGSFENTWNLSSLGTTSILSIIFITKFLGISVICMLVVLVMQLIKYRWVAISVIIVFSYLDGFYFDISLLFPKMIIDAESWNNTRIILANQFFLLALLAFLYSLCREIFNRKDFLN